MLLAVIPSWQIIELSNHENTNTKLCNTKSTNLCGNTKSAVNYFIKVQDILGKYIFKITFQIG